MGFKFLPLFLFFVLSGCDHLALQDYASSGAKFPSKASTLILEEDLNLEFKRGVLNDRFISILGAGQYSAIVESSNGMFYLAPANGFEYKNNQKVKSVVGGIFVENKTKDLFIWFAPQEFNQSAWSDWASGKNISKIKPGLTYLEFRPWVEKDFIIPKNKVQIESSTDK